jgi:hypothetical protein
MGMYERYLSMQKAKYKQDAPNQELMSSVVALTVPMFRTWIPELGKKCI